MKIVIETTSNGSVVKYPENKVSYKFEENDLEGIQEMLYDILEEVSLCTSRYDKERIQIKIVHGDKYECKDKNCKICKGE